MGRKPQESRQPRRCDLCGAEDPHIRRVTRSYGSAEDLLVIENIPLVSCPTCGESYVTAATLHELERLKQQRHTIGVGRTIEVVHFAA